MLTPEDAPDACALLDIHPRPIPRETILRTIMEQDLDHSGVSEECVALAQTAGVLSVSGPALVLDAQDASGLCAMLPPGWTRRNVDEWAVFFYGDDAGGPWVQEPVDKALTEEPTIAIPCALAVARWGEQDADTYWSLWMNFASADEAATTHAEQFARGDWPGVIAVAAGRLDGHVRAVEHTTWLFDALAT